MTETNAAMHEIHHQWWLENVSRREYREAAKDPWCWLVAAVWLVPALVQEYPHCACCFDGLLPEGPALCEQCAYSYMEYSDRDKECDLHVRCGVCCEVTSRRALVANMCRECAEEEGHA